MVDIFLSVSLCVSTSWRIFMKFGTTTPISLRPLLMIVDHALSLGRSVSEVTGFQMKDRDSSPGGGGGTFNHQMVPPSLLHSGYRGFLTLRVMLTNNLHLDPKLKMCGVINIFPYTSSSWVCY